MPNLRPSTLLLSGILALSIPTAADAQIGGPGAPAPSTSPVQLFHPAPPLPSETFLPTAAITVSRDSGSNLKNLVGAPAQAGIGWSTLQSSQLQHKKRRERWRMASHPFPQLATMQAHES
jgi:hypothetical protein